MRKSRTNQMKIARAVCSKIRKQIPDNADSMLIFDVFKQSVKDLFIIGEHRESAVEYLDGDMIHLSILGVDPEWAIHLLKLAGLSNLFSMDLYENLSVILAPNDLN